MNAEFLEKKLIVTIDETTGKASIPAVRKNLDARAFIGATLELSASGQTQTVEVIGASTMADGLIGIQTINNLLNVTYDPSTGKFAVTIGN